MGRKYDTARFLESVGLLRNYFDTPAITTDLIVGFPGETEDEFHQTLDFIKQCAFASMHIFPYSRRPGTPAAAMPDQIPAAVKEARAHEAIEAAERMEQSYLTQFVGQTLPILFEEEKNGWWQGHAPNYVCLRTHGENLHNQLRTMRVTGVDGNVLLGEDVSEPESERYEGTTSHFECCYEVKQECGCAKRKI